MPLQATSGAASYDAFGGGVAAVPNYIEDVFSTYLFETNTPSDVTVPNGIDLSGEGGLVWNKCRNDSFSHQLYDTNRGGSYQLQSNTTNAQSSYFAGRVEFGSDGFVWKSSGGWSTNSFVSWTFRKQPKFFDVVTYTGAGAGTTVSHNLGSTPGCVIVKATSGVDGWFVYHRDLLSAPPTNRYLRLDKTDATAFLSNWISVSDTTITFPTAYGPTASSGTTYVAYLFAHNAGGFGLTGTDNVISCGSYTGTGSALSVTLGYEPQWILVKRTTGGTNNWVLMDTMRGMSLTQASWLYPNLSDAEVDAGTQCNPTATGFTITSTGTNLNAGGDTYIYIAIRRGPMKVPTSGTSVFSPVAQAGNGGNDTVTTGFTTDLVIGGSRTANPIQGAVDRLRGRVALLTANTAAEDPCPSGRDLTSFASNTGFTLGYPPFATSFNYTGNNIYWNFRRAPSFFDEVCATPSYPTPITHNLGAVPKLRFEKTRTLTAEWKAIYFDGTTDEYELALNSTRAAQLQSGRPALPTSTSFVAYYDTVPIVVYLFAPVTGVQYISKFTGNGSSQTINCGFTGGARFICIKAFSSTGDWKVIDTARGIVSGNDPTLALNTTSAEVTGTDCIDPDSSGFIVNQESTNNLNVNGVEYLVWAIA